MYFNKHINLHAIATCVSIAFLCFTNTSLADSTVYQIKPASFLLAQTTASASQDAQSWLNKGYQLRSQGKHQEALTAFRKAESLGAGSERLTIDITDTYLEMGRERDAYYEISKVANSADFETRVKACEYREDLKYSRYRSLPDPYFADLGTTIGWQSIGDTGFIDIRGRFGIESGDDYFSQLYLFASVTDDNRSGFVGGFPEEYFESLASVGVGYLQKVLKNHELYFIAEAARSKELANVGRDDYDSHFTAGFEYYRDWGTEYDCRSIDHFPFRFILYTYGELKYYSRFDDSVFLSYEARPGLRVYETPSDTVDTYLIFSLNVNLENSNDNFYEAGLGATWFPDRQRDYNFTVRAVESYFDDGSSDFNFLVQFEHYINW